MMRKLIVAVLVIVLAFCASAYGVMIFDTPDKRDTSSSRIIPSDPKLPVYDNPLEIDLEDGNLHISFKGAFRYLDKDKKPSKYVVFCFVATPKKDMEIRIGQSELFDGKARRFRNGGFTPDIGEEETRRREIIEGIPIPIRFGFEMPIASAGELPSIARVSFSFNDNSYQFRNIKVEEWSVWESIYQELGL